MADGWILVCEGEEERLVMGEVCVGEVLDVYLRCALNRRDLVAVDGTEDLNITQYLKLPRRWQSI